MEETIQTIEIAALGSEGQGIGRLPSGKVCFVPGAIPGETVNVEITSERSKNADAKIVEILKASPNRIENTINLSGCNLAHMTYEYQLEYKQNRVKECLNRITGISEDTLNEVMKPIISSEEIYHYRNHMQYKIYEGKICATLRDSDIPVPLDDCAIEYKIFKNVRKALEVIFEDAPTWIFSGLVLRGSTRTKQVLVELVSDEEGPHEIVIRDVNEYVKATNLINILSDICSEEDYKLMGITLRISPDNVSKRTRSGKRVTITGLDYYEEAMCDRHFRVKAGAFFQVNVPQAENLYRAASEGLSDAKVLCDVYCGTGTIGLSCVKEGQELIGIESVSEAVASAKINAELSGVKNARFICRPAEKVDFKKEKIPNPDAIIVDPPRKGMDQMFVKYLMELSPEKISYVSCDPATMARDLKELIRKYEIVSVQPTDMFPFSHHIETVVLLSRKENNL